MNEQDRKILEDARKAMLDVAIRTGSSEEVMVLFAMAAAHQNLEMMADIVNHPELKVDDQDRMAMTAALKVCRGLMVLNDEIKDDPNITMGEIEQRIESLTSSVLEELDMVEDEDDAFERQAKVATDNLLSKFQLH
jgi:hypothetical protein